MHAPPLPGAPGHDAWLAAEAGRLLAFARGARVQDGFGWLDDAGRPDPAQPLELWIATRMIHVFALGHLLGTPGCAELVDHGVDALERSFRDREHGGWFASVRDGAPVTTDKTAYEHAFVLLAGASATVAGRPGGPALLDAATAVVEERFWSEDDGCCVEAWNRDWTRLDGYRGANANMHMTEAFLAAGDATGDARWAARALRIAERLIHDVARGHGYRLPEHFDADWTPQPDYNADAPRHPFRPYGVTPGHALEWSRLLVHLHATADAPPGWLLDDARALFARAVADGWEATGGFVYTTGLGGEPVVRDRFHWVAAEAVAAAAALHAATGDTGYADWYARVWAFITTHLRDGDGGSWRHELDGDLRPAAETWQGRPDVYHALQATLLPRLPPAPGIALALRDGLLRPAPGP